MLGFQTNSGPVWSAHKVGSAKLLSHSEPDLLSIADNDIDGPGQDAGR